MKKLFLTLLVSAISSLSSFAQITLIDAYTSLADLPGMKEKTCTTINVDDNTIIENTQTFAVNTVDVDYMRGQFFNMIESLPMREVIISANNQREFATVYAQPAENGSYNLLILKGNSVSGDFSATYAKTDKATVEAINNCELILDRDELVVVPPSGASTEFITMSN